MYKTSGYNDPLAERVANPWAFLARRILKGEQSTWPLISLIEARCKVELALDRGKEITVKVRKIPCDH
jgi:hypothetical protein